MPWLVKVSASSPQPVHRGPGPAGATRQALESGMVSDPVTRTGCHHRPPTSFAATKVSSGLPVVDAGGNLQDHHQPRPALRPRRWASLTVRECMTLRDRLITGETGISREMPRRSWLSSIVSRSCPGRRRGRLPVFITVKDSSRPSSTPRHQGRRGAPRVGGAIRN